MKNWIYIIALFSTASYLNAQQIRSIPYLEMEKTIKESKGLYVLNIWATWCKPCVSELPYFQKASEEFPEVHFLLASVDFSARKDMVLPFLETRNISIPSIHLSDSGDSEWIGLLDKDFSGAIPATALFKDGQKVYFHEGELTYEQLNTIIIKYLKEKK